MAGPYPVVRHFFCCEEVIEEDGPRTITIRRSISALGPSPGDEYPVLSPPLTLFAQMTGVRRAHDFGIEVRFWLQGQEIPLWRMKSVRMTADGDPLAVRGLCIRLNPLTLPRPGHYDFLLLCDGSELCRETILLREVP